MVLSAHTPGLHMRSSSLWGLDGRVVPGTHRSAGRDTRALRTECVDNGDGGGEADVI